MSDEWTSYSLLITHHWLLALGGQGEGGLERALHGVVAPAGAGHPGDAELAGQAAQGAAELGAQEGHQHEGIQAAAARAHLRERLVPVAVEGGVQEVELDARAARV